MKVIKIILPVIMVLTISCVSTKKSTSTQSYLTSKNNSTFSLKEEMNKAVLDGFFDNDSTKIPPNTFFF